MLSSWEAIRYRIHSRGYASQNRESRKWSRQNEVCERADVLFGKALFFSKNEANKGKDMSFQGVVVWSSRLGVKSPL
jgi:hypothetical protein